MQERPFEHGKYFFYWRFRTIRGENVRWDRVKPPAPPRKTLREVVGSVWGTVAFFYTICFLPRQAHIFFNHTTRVRKTGKSLRSVYLEQPLAASRTGPIIIFDEKDLGIEYPGGLRSHSYAAVDVCLSQCSRFCFWWDRDYAFFQLREYFWSLVLTVLRPRAVFFFVWYGKPWIIAAAKNAKVRSIELQHGLIYRDHEFYQLEPAAGITGAHFLVPDEIWCYGAHWRDVLIANGYKPEKIKISGYIPDISPQQSLGKKYLAYISNGERPDELRTLLSHIQPELNRRGYAFVVAPHPHPAENVRESFDQLVRDYGVILAHEIDSYDICVGADAVISFGSTMLWECLRFRRPGYILEYSENCAQAWTSLLATGFVRLLKQDQFPEPFQLPAPEASAPYFSEFDWPELPRKDVE